MASYAYDAVSRLASLTENLGGTAHDLTLGFSYNPASQIASNTRSNDAYAWTGHGWGSTASTANGLNQLTQTGGTTITHDARGNVTSDGVRTYGYTVENLLARANGADTFALDALGRIYHWSPQTSFTYRPNGQVETLTDAENNKTTYVGRRPGRLRPLLAIACRAHSATAGSASSRDRRGMTIFSPQGWGILHRVGARLYWAVPDGAGPQPSGAKMVMSKLMLVAAGALALVTPTEPAEAIVLGPDAASCRDGADSPALLVNVTGFKSRAGRIRVQLYGSNPRDFLAKGKKMRRIDLPVTSSGPMRVCVAVPKTGSYAIAVRHDVQGNGSDWNDGGGFSRNPRLSLFDLKPKYAAVNIPVGQGVEPIDVVLNYRQGLTIKPIRSN